MIPQRVPLAGAAQFVKNDVDLSKLIASTEALRELGHGQLFHNVQSVGCECDLLHAANAQVGQREGLGHIKLRLMPVFLAALLARQTQRKIRSASLPAAPGSVQGRFEGHLAAQFFSGLGLTLGPGARSSLNVPSVRCPTRLAHGDGDLVQSCAVLRTVRQLRLRLLSRRLRWTAPLCARSPGRTASFFRCSGYLARFCGVRTAAQAAWDWWRSKRRSSMLRPRAACVGVLAHARGYVPNGLRAFGQVEGLLGVGSFRDASALGASALCAWLGAWRRCPTRRWCGTRAHGAREGQNIVYRLRGGGDG